MFRHLQHDRKTVTVFIDDAPVEAEAGEMMATVLLRHNLLATHRSPQGQPRGPYCMMGVCFDCMITLGDGRSEQACQTLAEEGLRIYRRLDQADEAAR